MSKRGDGPAALSPVQLKFVLHWGEMGTRWGINRSVAQIHALLYLSPEPLPAESIADTLSIARSNVSTSLRELQGWGIVRVVHRLGDRRDHFETLGDPWEMFRVIVEERKKREIDPTLEVLRECLAEAESSRAEAGHTRQRLGQLVGFLETLLACYGEVRGLPAESFAKMVRMGGKIRQALGV